MYECAQGARREYVGVANPWTSTNRASLRLSSKVEHEPRTRLRHFCSLHDQDSALHPIVAQLERAALVRDTSPETVCRCSRSRSLNPSLNWRRCSAGACGVVYAARVRRRQIIHPPNIGCTGIDLVTLGWVGDRMRLPTSLEAPAKGPLKGVGLSGDRQRTAHPGAVSQRLDRRC
jgi:hypothetical protein